MGTGMRRRGQWKFDDSLLGGFYIGQNDLNILTSSEII